MTTIFAALPLNEAMPDLLPARPHKIWGRVEGELASPHEMAGLWLYVDALERSHAISQNLEDATGCAWHAIMHRREGDFGNSKYWWRRAGSHPAFAGTGYDPVAFVNAVAKAKGNDPDLVDVQRREWQMLFDWCVRQELGG